MTTPLQPDAVLDVPAPGFFARLGLALRVLLDATLARRLLQPEPKALPPVEKVVEKIVERVVEVEKQHAGGADLFIDTWPDLFFDGCIGFWSASYWKTPSGIVERGENMPVFAGIFKAGCSGPGRGKTQPANFAGARCPSARDPL